MGHLLAEREALLRVMEAVSSDRDWSEAAGTDPCSFLWPRGPSPPPVRGRSGSPAPLRGCPASPSLPLLRGEGRRRMEQRSGGEREWGGES